MKTNELLLSLGVNRLYIEAEDNGVGNERVICEVSLVSHDETVSVSPHPLKKSSKSRTRMSAHIQRFVKTVQE